MADSTTILFVPGAWHNPDCFDLVVQVLEAAHYKTDKVHLPSVNAPTPLLDFAPDVTQIRTQIEKAADAGRKVLVVVHSYGALPANEAIRGLEMATRKSQGLPGGVSHLFFCCSFVIPEGDSLISAFGGNDLPWFLVAEDRLLVDPDTPEFVFYNDCEEGQTKSAVAALRTHSYQTFLSPCTYAAWKHVPSTYLYCLRDEAIPMAVQRMMVEETAKGYDMRTETLDASHSPFFSMPVDMAEAIRRAAERG
ncbi:alpha/beta-hydrolase [Aspergillus heteromorphus CBS 117.55]|uniref:Alpha/beta-hydrolase n=1 Tax=Aspergillus heteromorphus CBS 117.55 TaxID=1448321 RepID=A0A317VCN4_9EURO|nr:alpha/beta-hydrolase [Aspergillus heteromorphus CBS 117.55]PWY71011.1 alpha/beta-hydrolase [Aspergillus heteromorphus CBS 117.55]